MTAKEKHKGKPKRNSRRFIVLGIFIILTLFAGLVFILIPDGCACSLTFPPETTTAIVRTNEAAFTQISASATAAAHIRATHATIGTDAAATLEQAHATAYYSDVQLTATALDCLCVWDFDDKTATSTARTAIAATNVLATQNSISTVEAEITSTIIYLQQTASSLPLWFYNTPTPNP